MIQRLLFLDIETIPVKYTFSELTEKEKKLWTAKWRFNPDLNPEEQYQKAGIFSEFSKVICIGLGYIDDNNTIHLKCLFHEDERVLLNAFNDSLNKFFQHTFKKYNAEYSLCAHNGREFDFPFLCRRMLINNIAVPDVLKSGRKEYLQDTMEMWKFGDYKHYTSLDLLAHVFDIESPKDNLDGSMVAKAFYELNQKEEIQEYCLKDVATLIKVYQKLNSLPLSTEISFQ